MGFSGILCATRFKIFDQQGMTQEVKRLERGGADSSERSIWRSEVGPKSFREGMEEMLEFLRRTVKVAARYAPFGQRW